MLTQADLALYRFKIKRAFFRKKEPFSKYDVIKEFGLSEEDAENLLQSWWELDSRLGKYTFKASRR